MNRKRTQRLYGEEGLSVRKRRGRKKATETQAPLVTVAPRNARWKVDFVHHQSAKGRLLRIYKVIDDVTNEYLVAVVDTSISGRGLAREVNALGARHNKTGLIVNDHSTEFTLNAMPASSDEMGVPSHFIAQGKPMQNGTCEAIDSKMRD